MVEQSVTKSPRIEMVDALRGFAVMAIILVHNLEHFIFPVYPENTPEWLGVLAAAAVSFAPLYTLKELLMGSGSAIMQQSAGTALDMWQKLAFTLVLVSSFVILYRDRRFCKWWLGRHRQGPMEYIWHKWTWINKKK